MNDEFRIQGYLFEDSCFSLLEKLTNSERKSFYVPNIFALKAFRIDITPGQEVGTS